MITISTTGKPSAFRPAKNTVPFQRVSKSSQPRVKFGTDPGTAFSFYAMLAGFGAVGGLLGTLGWLAHKFDPDPPEVRKLRKALRKAAFKKRMQDPEFWRSHPLSNPYDPMNPWNKGWRL